MALFVLSSDITIGNFQFSGVNEVRIQRSIHSLTDKAVIKIPSIARVINKGKANAEDIITGDQFSDGDPVVIKLGYNGNLLTEFEGFVKRRNLDMPLEVECEGYSLLLRRNQLNAFYPTISIKDYLLAAVSGLENNYNINVLCGLEFNLGNVFFDNISGIEALNNLSKYTDGSLTCFFIQPDTLWCGLVYTPYANGDDPFNNSGTTNMISYRLGYNALKENSLKERISENDPVKVIYSKKLANGHILSQASDVYPKYVRKHSRTLNHLRDAATLKMLANEQAYKLNYSGYEGNINGFLQPNTLPGYRVYITDDRYPERNGNYLTESTEVHFGVNGARRIVEAGPLNGFINT